MFLMYIRVKARYFFARLTQETQAASGDFILAVSLRIDVHLWLVCYDFHESILFQQTEFMMCSIKSKEELTISRKDLYAVLYDQQKSVTHRNEGKYNNPWWLNDKWKTIQLLIYHLWWKPQTRF